MFGRARPGPPGWRGCAGYHGRVESAAMTTQTASNPAVAFIREGARLGHWYLDGTMADVTREQAHYSPPGRANPIGATFAHLVCSEDMVINGMLQQRAPLSATSH